MRAPESPFERYTSERILSFAELFNVSLSFRAQSAKKTCLRFAIYNFSEKLLNNFEMGSLKKSFERKIRRHFFVVDVLIYPLPKFGDNRTNSLWVLAFYSVRFKRKNWFAKTALNMSIRRVIFISGKNLKPSFLCQHLICFKDFFFTLENSFESLLQPKTRNLKKIVDLKVYCNLKIYFF